MAFIGRLGKRTTQTAPIKRTTTVSTATPDTTPDQFFFADVTGVATSTLQTSNQIIVKGITVATTASVTGGQMQRNGGLWVSTDLVAQPGDTFVVRHISSNSNLTPTDTTLTIGGVSDTFTSTTGAGSSTAGQSVGLLLGITRAS